MLRFVFLLFAFTSVASLSHAQTQNTELLSNWNPGGGGRRAFSDIWGYHAPDGTELAIIGRTAGVSFVDVTIPGRPQEVGFVDLEPSLTRDIRTYDHYAHMVNERGGGMQIVDLANPLQPLPVAVYDSTFDTAHNIGIYDGIAYVVGARKAGASTGTHMLDLSNPTSPVQVGFYGAKYLHDIIVRNNVIYGSAIQNRGLEILDITDKMAPGEISFTTYPGAATHAAWLTRDSRYLLTADEIDGGHIHVWDVQKPASPIQVAEWSANPNATVHNVFVRGDSAYISYYTEGLQVLNIADPTAPFRVASYDTWPGLSGGTEGNWGVYPFLPSGNILLSDMMNGLFVVRLVTGGNVGDFVLSAPSPQQANPGVQQIIFTFELVNMASKLRTFEISASTSLGWDLSFPHLQSVGPNGLALINVLVTVPPTLSVPTTVNVELCARSPLTNNNSCVNTDAVTPVLLQFFAVTTAVDYVDVSWHIEKKATDSGQLVLLRALSVTPDAWHELARFDLVSHRYQDDTVERGQRYAYFLGLENSSGFRLLGQQTVTLAPPGASRLLGNAPNPFNPQTRIRFQLAQPGDVRLLIFDGRGRRIQNLLAPGLSPGSQQLFWDGRDRAGNLQPSGVYFYEVRSHRWSARGRMTMLR